MKANPEGIRLLREASEHLAKAPTKLKGKKLESLISKTYYKHGHGVQINIMDIGKIYHAAETAYNGAATAEEAEQALDEAMKTAIAKYRIASVKTAARHVELKHVRSYPFLEPTWVEEVPGEKAVRMDMGGNLPQYVWSDTPKEMASWMDRIISRAKDAKVALAKMA